MTELYKKTNKKKFLVFYSILIISFFSQLSFAQSSSEESCSNQYNEISANCIKQKLQGDLSDITITFGKENLKFLNQVYFFQDNAGNIGKFKIGTLGLTKKDCSAFIESTIFLKGVQHNKQLTFSINNNFGKWISETQTIHIDTQSLFKLQAVEKMSDGVVTVSCKLSLENAKGIAFKKIESAIESDRMILYYAAIFLIGLAVFIVASAIFKDEERFKAQEKLDDASEDSENRNKKTDDFVLKLSRPFFKRYFSPIVSGMKSKKQIKEKYRRKLASAGLTKDLSPEDFYAFKLFLIIGFPLLFIAIRTLMEETWPLTLIPLIALVGFVYPDFWIKGRAEKRRAEILYNLPFVVDMLALCTEAGLDFMAAMQRVIEKAKNSALTEEIEILLKETKIGASRAEALRQLSWRIDTIEISSFTATLIAADSVGASIAPILKTLSGEIRQKRSAEAEKKGATAATKILFPTMFLIMPAVGIMIFAPMLMQFISG